MLPRLRFVVAAVVIALLPMVFLGSGAVTTARDPLWSDISRAEPSLRVSDARDSQLLVLAYARRNSELERLRELANVPLRTWVQSPTGSQGAVAPAVAPPDDRVAAPVATIPSSDITTVPVAEQTAPTVVARLPDAVRDSSTGPDGPPAEPTTVASITPPDATVEPLRVVPFPRSRPKITGVTRHRHARGRFFRRRVVGPVPHVNPPGLFEELVRNDQTRAQPAQSGYAVQGGYINGRMSQPSAAVRPGASTLP